MTNFLAQHAANQMKKKAIAMVKKVGAMNSDIRCVTHDVVCKGFFAAVDHKKLMADGIKSDCHFVVVKK